MNYIRYKGEYCTSTEPTIHVDNRAFHFGDGFFESMRAINGKVCFCENHFKRIQTTCKALNMEIPDGFSLEFFEEEVNQLLLKNGIEQGGRVRATFFRESTGYYLPHGHQFNYVIEAYPLDDNYFKINENGKTIEVYPDIRKDVNLLSMYKTLNCGLYIMASLYAHDKNLDDALIQNSDGTIIESTSANLFLVSNGVLYTPALEQGCVAGTMRMNIINIAIEKGIKVYECVVNPQNLLVADEIFLSNAVNGVQWVSSYRTKRYFNDLSKEMINMLNKHVSEF